MRKRGRERGIERRRYGEKREREMKREKERMRVRDEKGSESVIFKCTSSLSFVFEAYEKKKRTKEKRKKLKLGSKGEKEMNVRMCLVQ